MMKKSLFKFDIKSISILSPTQHKEVNIRAFLEGYEYSLQEMNCK